MKNKTLINFYDKEVKTIDEIANDFVKFCNQTDIVQIKYSSDEVFSVFSNGTHHKIAVSTWHGNNGVFKPIITVEKWAPEMTIENIKIATN